MEKGSVLPLFDDDALVPISALQHFVYCARQCALIHLEGCWLENQFTAEGTILHETVDETGRRHEHRGHRRVSRGLQLKNRRLGLVGRADVVEFHAPVTSDCIVSGGAGRTLGGWAPFPVEYKRGRPKSHQADRVQLCAQALCLEEMLDTDVPAGALFYGQSRHRTGVDFDTTLRNCTEEVVLATHELLANGITPKEPKGPKCRRCSLLPVCLPEVTGGKRSARSYLERARQSLIEA